MKEIKSLLYLLCWILVESKFIVLTGDTQQFITLNPKKHWQQQMFMYVLFERKLSKDAAYHHYLT